MKKRVIVIVLTFVFAVAVILGLKERVALLKILPTVGLKGLPSTSFVVSPKVWRAPELHTSKHLSVEDQQLKANKFVIKKVDVYTPNGGFLELYLEKQAEEVLVARSDYQPSGKYTDVSAGLVLDPNGKMPTVLGKSIVRVYYRPVKYTDEVKAPIPPEFVEFVVQ